jgi:zinc and cadmium transporter
MTYLILTADGLHNFFGGLAISGVFMVDIKVGISAWLAAAMHEIPQELGDFGVLVKGGWDKKSALLYNFASGLTFLLGGMVAYFSSTHFNLDTHYLIAFGAGNLISIAASDLVPQSNKEQTTKSQITHYSAFCGGLVLLYVLAITV